MNIGIRLKNDLLEIDLNSINVSKDEIQEILHSIQRKKSYHRLKNGDFINDEPVDAFNHLIDAIRYALEDEMQFMATRLTGIRPF